MEQTNHEPNRFLSIKNKGLVIRELRVYVFLGPDQDPIFFKPISGTLCAHEQIKGQGLSSLLATLEKMSMNNV